jgi:hypothetical protein
MEENQNVNKEKETVDIGTEDAVSNGGGMNSDTANVTPGETVNDSAFTDSQKSDPKENGTAKEDKHEGQNKEQNAENARRRREAERQKEMRELREKTIIDALNGKNPYTGEPMKDSFDVAEFETMREIEKNGGDPVSDYPRFRKQKEREAAAEMQEKGKTAEWYANDKATFEKDFPSVNLSELIADEDFNDYAEGKVGRRPLSDIYRGYLKFQGKVDSRAKDMAAQYIANKNASPGALHNTNPVDSDYFTPEQVRGMTTEEVRKNYEKIIKSMEKWNN